jgi:hypothetical protein
MPTSLGKYKTIRTLSTPISFPQFRKKNIIIYILISIYLIYCYLYLVRIKQLVK